LQKVNITIITNVMKRTQIMLACALVLAFSGVTNLHATEEGLKEGKATIRAMHGSVEYFDNGTWLPAKPNMKFGPGIAIRTGADGVADLAVNGMSSAVRLTNNTVLRIPTMSYVGSDQEGDRTTMLNLESGSIIGNVKKITANSRYEIMTPHGVAGIRGTDFAVEVIRYDNINFRVTFSSISGVITVSAVVNGTTETRTLNTGMSWTIGEDVKRISPEYLEYLQRQIINLVMSMVPPGPIVSPRGPIILPPFIGGPPQGRPASQ